MSPYRKILFTTNLLYDEKRDWLQIVHDILTVAQYEHKISRILKIANVTTPHYRDEIRRLKMATALMEPVKGFFETTKAGYELVLAIRDIYERLGWTIYS